MVDIYENCDGAKVSESDLILSHRIALITII